MDKYQEALNKIKYIIDSINSFKDPFVYNESIKLSKHYDALQELIDQNKKPTFKECIEEWKALGYEWVEGYYINGYEIYLLLSFENKNKTIMIYPKSESYKYIDNEIDGTVADISFQENQLLTKTFKALGW